MAGNGSRELWLQVFKRFCMSNLQPSRRRYVTNRNHGLATLWDRPKLNLCGDRVHGHTCRQCSHFAPKKSCEDGCNWSCPEWDTCTACRRTKGRVGHTTYCHWPKGNKSFAPIPEKQNATFTPKMSTNHN